MPIRIMIKKSSKPEDAEYPWLVWIADKAHLNCFDKDKESAVGYLMFILAASGESPITVEDLT